MDDSLFDWDTANIAHIAVHGVTPEEAEEVVFGDPMELDFDVENGEERWTYVGESRAGRVLTVLFTTRGERIRVVTAFAPSPLRMRIYLEWRAKPL
jgi:uncharacterized DUF497 family protein